MLQRTPPHACFRVTLHVKRVAVWCAPVKRLLKLSTCDIVTDKTGHRFGLMANIASTNYSVFLPCQRFTETDCETTEKWSDYICSTGLRYVWGCNIALWCRRRRLIIDAWMPGARAITLRHKLTYTFQRSAKKTMIFARVLLNFAQFHTEMLQRRLQNVPVLNILICNMFTMTFDLRQ